MPAKRIINRDDYPMVLDWSVYENVLTKLPCKCQHCEHIFYRTITKLDLRGDSYCIKCSNSIKKEFTCLKKYGTKHPVQSKIVREKTKQTNLKKYSVENVSQLNVIKKKKKETSLKNYGIEYPQKLDKIKEKVKQTNLKKYGGIAPLQSNVIKEKVKQTNLKKYGVENVFQCKKSKEKSKKSNLLKYGTPSFNQRNRTLEQIEITTSKENLEKYLISLNKKITIYELSKLLGFKYKDMSGLYIKKYNLHQYINSHLSIGEKELTEYINLLGFLTEKKRFSFGEIDIYIPVLKIGFEFNGDYWHGNPLLYEDDFIIRNGNTAKEKRLSDKRKIKSAHMMGIKIFTIWENDWKNNQDETKLFIKNKLNYVSLDRKL